MSGYRKIYEQHHGPIPKDKDGRTYEFIILMEHIILSPITRTRINRKLRVRIVSKREAITI